jgi:NTE family protein
VAFHLGCLRALHDRDLLDRVQVVSGVSGGALLAAMWTYGPTSFQDFDDTVVALLRRGLQRELWQRASHPATVVCNLATALRTVIASVASHARHGIGESSMPLRQANRTDALVTALADGIFGARRIDDVTHPGLNVVLTACDLRTSNAVRFGSARSSCSPYGTIHDPITVAEAVAASAALTLLLPALERTYTFQHPKRASSRQPVLLTDGGIYDNLALSVLEPGRSATHTPHVYTHRYIIACDAGRGEPKRVMPHFLPGRIKRSFQVTHRRAQNSARARLHEAATAGQLDGFVLAYLGMPDQRLPIPVADLIPHARVADYPTNFQAMTQNHLNALAVRGEQLVRILLQHYCPNLT